MKTERIDWDNIDTVLLDMDGTLIDNRHEEVFWHEILPKAYAKKNGVGLEEAKHILFKKYSSVSRKKLIWGDINAWGRMLEIKNLRQVRMRIKPFIRLHPHTLRFLKFLKKRRKNIYLVTAADPMDVDIEIAHTRIGKYLNGIFTTFDLGATKHKRIFWTRLHKKLKFDKTHTLLAEDNEDIIRVAEAYGIRYLVFKSKSSSKKPPYIPKGLFCVHHFDDLLPKAGQ